ncbi:hypothetical protein PARHAE_02444 [Paracoccus haematequi]|uniref:Uncharacterized protein n=1 Tax=Paracoccus haematequi TaxID=2491866 RepID=A0A447INZ1_9RHOB|nr:hypothetical protein [Paracoccus haematequi]VDS09252.1 hypothetical protein PARHAE_02444 [Paracoccus haematequi]
MTVRPDLLAALPQLAADQVKSWLPHLATCKGIVGRIDLAEVKRLGIQSPAVLVSRFGARVHQTLAGPHRHYLVDLAAFVVTKDMMGLGRNDAAAAITQALLTRLPDLDMAVEGVGEVSDLAEHSLITTDVQKEGIALWAVTWKLRVALVAHPESDPIAPRLYVGWAPEIGAAHEADYDLVGGQP